MNKPREVKPSEMIAFGRGNFLPSVQGAARTTSFRLPRVLNTGRKVRPPSSLGEQRGFVAPSPPSSRRKANARERPPPCRTPRSVGKRGVSPAELRAFSGKSFIKSQRACSWLPEPPWVVLRTSQQRRVQPSLKPRFRLDALTRTFAPQSHRQSQWVLPLIDSRSGKTNHLPNFRPLKSSGSNIGAESGEQDKDLARGRQVPASASLRLRSGSGNVQELVR